MEDSSLFNDKEIDKPLTAANQRNAPFESEMKPEDPVISSATSPNEPADLLVSEKKSGEMSPTEAIPQSSTWGSAVFFDDAFASSPFNDPASSGNDAFGFPESAVASEDQTFFDDSPDAWGEPSSLKSSLKPVDFTPRRSNLNFHGSAFDNDAMSYDASEMSEVTNPTFMTRPDQEGDETGRSVVAKKGTGHMRQPSQGSSSQEPSESAVPLLGVNSNDSLDGAEGEKPADESESQKENKGGGNDTGSLLSVNRSNKLPPSYNENPADANDDPPLASLDDFSDDDATPLDISKDSQQTAPSFAKSRIMEKYSKGGRLRKPSRNDNRNKPPPPPTQMLQEHHTTSQETTDASQTMFSTSSKSAVTRSIQPEVATGMHSKQRASFSPHRPIVARVGSDSSSIDSASARRNERIQRTNRLNQEKREAMASKEAKAPRAESPNPTSLVYRRRGGRMPSNQHTLELDRSLDNSFSSESKNRKKDPYSAKKKAAPSLLDDPNYYNVRSLIMKKAFFYVHMFNLTIFTPLILDRWKKN